MYDYCILHLRYSMEYSLYVMYSLISEEFKELGHKGETWLNKVYVPELHGNLTFAEFQNMWLILAEYHTVAIKLLHSRFMLLLPFCLKIPTARKHF